MLKGISSIIGKWNGNEYKIIRKIGEGGMGEIYKVKDKAGNIKAIKVSFDVSSITREFNILKELSVIDGVPRAYELDDYCPKKRGATFYFFVMELIEGENLKEIIRKRKLKANEIIGIGLILLRALHKIKDKGYTYTDIKLENILVDKVNHRILFVDFGGIINSEWGIREYTPTYNLISWGIKEEYNPIESTVFGVTMLMVSLLLRREYNPLYVKTSDIIRQIRRMNISYEMKKMLINGLKVKFENIEVFMSELNNLMIRLNTQKLSKSRNFDAINIFFIVSLCIFISVMFYGLNIILK